VLEENKPRPIDPSAIRNSVRRALGKLEVDRSARQPMPQHLKPRKRPAKRAREDKRDRVARHRAREEADAAEQKKIRLTEFISVQELAQKLEVSASELITKLFGLGVMATMNQRLEREQIELLIADYPIEYQWLDAVAGEDIEVEEDEGSEVSRPPVVTVMGHVDHGKTTLLDYLRKTNVTAGEAGGITQHIGAYQVPTNRGVISFLDTPGHEAFTAMRARGAKVTDIVVVVIAADDKVMPQTEEAISHARASGCPIIIAINKIDLPAADPSGVKQQLTQYNVVVEDFGGDVQCVEISAKKGINIDALLEAIQLQAELLELKAVASGRAVGAVLEAHIDQGRGVVFTVLVTRGTLRVGDPFVVGSTSGRVRAMLDEHEDPVESAGPSRPVVVLGCDEVPGAGDTLNVMPSEKEAKEVAGKRRQLQREQALHAPKRALSLETLFDRIQEAEQIELPVIIKGDVAGSVEAISDNLMNLAHDKVAVQILHAGVGAINENDITLAAASGAFIIGFHLRPTPAIRAMAKEHNVDLRLYDIIYEVVDEVKRAMRGMLAPVEREVATGSAEVRNVFRIPRIGVIAGCYVVEGTVKRNAKVRVIRDQVQVYEGTVSSLKRFKEDAREVRSGFECGIGDEGFQDIKVGDMLDVFEIVEEAAEL
jgi:translation initiation factor IF-2